MAKNQGIKGWPEDERPREKLLKSGEHTLNNTELLAILLRTGTKGESAIDLARKVILKFKTFRNMSHTDIRDWKEFKGLGKAKIAQLKAAIEIGRRFLFDEKREFGEKVKSSKEAADLMMPRMRDLKKELFKVLLLDSQNRIISTPVEIEEGTVNQASPAVREIIHQALQGFASSIICVHNHPSGNPSPSREDKDFTKQLVEAGNLVQVKVIDHIIIGDNIFFSFADHNLI